MKEIYIVVKITSIDYEGSETEIISAYNSRLDAQSAVRRLIDENHKWNIEYHYESHNII